MSDKHIYHGHKPDKSIKKKIPCVFCGKLFDSIQATAMHESMRHKKLFKKKLKEIQNG